MTAVLAEPPAASPNRRSAPPVVAPALPAVPVLHRWSAETYERMVVLGILTPEDKAELLDGLVVDKMPEGLPHAYAIGDSTHHFVLRVADRWVTRSQTAVHLDGSLVPGPDVGLLRPRRGAYSHRRPRPEDIFLPIEVSESSLLIDRGDKLRAYARVGVPGYWIVNLTDRAVEVHRDPVPDAAAYRDVRVVPPGESVAPIDFPDAAVAVGDLLGWPPRPVGVYPLTAPTVRPEMKKR